MKGVACEVYFKYKKTRFQNLEVLLTMANPCIIWRYQNNELRTVSFDAFPPLANNHLHWSKFSSLAPSALAMH